MGQFGSNSFYINKLKNNSFIKWVMQADTTSIQTQL